MSIVNIYLTDMRIYRREGVNMKIIDITVCNTCEHFKEPELCILQDCFTEWDNTCQRWELRKEEETNEN